MRYKAFRLTRRRLLTTIASGLLLPRSAYATGGLISGSPGLVPNRLLATRVASANYMFGQGTQSGTLYTQAMVRTSHTALVAITSAALVLQNYCAKTFNSDAFFVPDTGPGAAATVTASIEYPSGTFTQIKFGGSPTGTIPDKDFLVSDYVNISIPKNTQFWTRRYQTNPIALVNQGGFGFSAVDGDFSNMGTSGVADQTMGGTITTNVGYDLPPLGIIGPSSSPSVVVVGTSIAAGVGDNLSSPSGLHGYNQSLTTTPNLNLAQGGANTLGWISDHPIHQKMFQYCTAMLTDHGENDYTITDTTTCLSRLQTLYALMRGKQIFQTTMLPRVATSSDGFTTIGGQSSQEFPTEQRALNAALRAGTPNVSVLCDVDNLLESSFQSGWWRVATDGFGNAAPFTVDGTHVSHSGQLVILDNLGIDQSKFT